jgi:hypothetical protein
MFRTKFLASTSPTTNMTETREHVKPTPEAEVAEEVVPTELGGCPVASVRRAAETFRGRAETQVAKLSTANETAA